MKKIAKCIETKTFQRIILHNMHAVKDKTKTFEAKYKARAHKAEAMDMISCPRGEGLSSRTTSLATRIYCASD